MVVKQLYCYQTISDWTIIKPVIRCFMMDIFMIKYYFHLLHPDLRQMQSHHCRQLPMDHHQFQWCPMRAQFFPRVNQNLNHPALRHLQSISVEMVEILISLIFPVNLALPFKNPRVHRRLTGYLERTRFLSKTYLYRVPDGHLRLVNCMVFFYKKMVYKKMMLDCSKS